MAVPIGGPLLCVGIIVEFQAKETLLKLGKRKEEI
jgi:hypothetical protein